LHKKYQIAYYSKVTLISRLFRSRFRYRGLQFSKLDGSQVVIDRYWQKIRFYFKHNENVYFFDHLHFKFGLKVVSSQMDRAESGIN